MADTVENEPLLSEQPEDGQAERLVDVEEAQERPLFLHPCPEIPRRLARLSGFSVALCMIIFAILVVVSILVSYNKYFYSYTIQESVGQVAILTLFIFISDGINLVGLRWQNVTVPPAWFAAGIDLIFIYVGIYINVLQFILRDNDWNSVCREERHGDKWVEVIGCREYLKKIGFVFISAALLGLVITLIHIVMFVQRCILIHRTRNRTGRARSSSNLLPQFLSGPWRFPHGQISVEFRLRFLRDPERTVATNPETSGETNPDVEAPVPAEASQDAS